MDLRRRIKNGYFLVFLSIVCFAFACFWDYNSSKDTSHIVNSFEKKLHQKEIIAERGLEFLIKQPDSLFYNDGHSYNEDFYDEHGILFLVYDRDSLKYWTAYSPAFDNLFPRDFSEKKIIRLKNGWFELLTKKSGNNLFAGLILIKNEYAFENRYLENSFQQDFKIAKESKVKTENDPLSLSFAIKNLKNEHLFYLSLKDTYPTYTGSLLLNIIFYIAGIVFLLSFLNHALVKHIPRLSVSIIIAILIILLRYFSIKNELPAFFYDLYLFKPQLYGDASSVWLTSLGDLLINIALLTYIVIVLFKKSLNISPSSITNTYIKSFIVFGLIILSYAFSRIINYTISSLIMNSNIPLSINNIFNLNLYSFIIFIVIGMILFLFYHYANKITDFIIQLSTPLLPLGITFFSSLAVITITSHLMGELDEILFLWSSFTIMALFLIKTKLAERGMLIKTITLLVIVTFYLSHLLFKFTEFKENNLRLILAERYSSERDPIAEHLFSESETKINADSILIKNLVHPEINTEKWKEKIIQKYFGGYWKKYKITISLVSDNKSNMLLPQNIKPTQNNNFYYVDDPYEDIKYIGFVLLKDTTSFFSEKLVIEFDSRFFSEGAGFPELLIDRENSIYNQLRKYSFAKYRNKKLVEFYGGYPYSIVDTDHIKPDVNHYYFEKNGYTHLLYKNINNSYVILSTKSNSLFDKLTAFSFLFAFYSLLLVILLLAIGLLKKEVLIDLSLKNRIQYALIAIIFIATLLFSGASVLYIKKQFEKNNKKMIEEKILTASEEIHHELGADEIISPGFIEYSLQNASYIFSSDFTLYNTSGNIIASSIPRLYTEGLVSGKMCPEAFYELNIEKKNQFTDNEKIGNLEYLSTYVPFRDKDGEIMGFLNMPYFSKQNELGQEISDFLAAIINIYVLLFLLSVTITFFIAGYLTYPLSLIKEKMRKVKLGNINEPIDWKKNDEIGSLIDEYNRMIKELAISTELLTKSERESAWREMAKQVAHEIKNPLTPMKLNIQHFQKTWKEYETASDEKIKQFTESLIEQIEILSSIANEFWHFAKMPKAFNKKINLTTIIHHCIELYINTSNIRIEYSSKLTGDAWIYADKEQMIRAFNNLIKNAIQSIPKEREGIIKISLERKNDSYIIEIKDNGIGINEELKGKIFTPSFTTKTSGMGLGLAMTKNIIESFNGKIGFETEEGKGTSFIISLPIFNIQSYDL